MKINNIVKLIISILVCQFAGVVGSFFTTPSIATWYAELEKPFFNPPNWVFGPVWVTLFLLMGISVYLIWDRGLEGRKVKIAILIFGVQLVLNTFWSIIFFGLHSPFYAFLEIVILWLTIIATIMLFFKISRVAAYLLFPYMAWVSFAAILNFSIFILN